MYIWRLLGPLKGSSWRERNGVLEKEAAFSHARFHVTNAFARRKIRQYIDARGKLAVDRLEDG